MTNHDKSCNLSEQMLAENNWSDYTNDYQSCPYFQGQPTMYTWIFFFSEIPRSKEMIFKIELVGLLGPLKDQITEIITSIAKCMQNFFKKFIFN